MFRDKMSDAMKAPVEIAKGELRAARELSLKEQEAGAGTRPTTSPFPDPFPCC